MSGSGAVCLFRIGRCGYLWPMKVNWVLKGALLAGISVALGAFAAHGLAKHLESGLMTERQMHNFETAARYQMYHALAILLCAFLLRQSASRVLKAAPWLFALGILFFSGSLYLLSVRDVIGLENWHWLGPVTPFGGLCFIAGWVMVAIGSLNRKLS
jgi:uncharacterized membrane protein YgdD (TMEM256/DUF423 family)